MPGPVAILIWYTGTALELAFVVCSLAPKSFLQYFFLNLYLILAVTSSVGRHFILNAYGQGSDEYTYSYAVVAQSAHRLSNSTSFAYDLSQNLYFVGRVLTYILWGAVMKLHETRTR